MKYLAVNQTKEVQTFTLYYNITENYIMTLLRKLKEN